MPGYSYTLSSLDNPAYLLDLGTSSCPSHLRAVLLAYAGTASNICATQASQVLDFAFSLYLLAAPVLRQRTALPWTLSPEHLALSGLALDQHESSQYLPLWESLVSPISSLPLILTLNLPFSILDHSQTSTPFMLQTLSDTLWLLWTLGMKLWNSLPRRAPSVNVFCMRQWGAFNVL